MESPEPAPNSRNEGSLLRAIPFLSAFFSLACCGIYLKYQLQKKGDDDDLSHYGYLESWDIWDGGYWALLTSSFVHLEFLHLAFNVYWLWVLGRRVEQSIGALRFLLFVAFTSFVSSSCELAFSDSTGIGASGIGYALFGFMWPLRSAHPEFKKVLDASTIRWFFLWMLLCIVMDVTDTWGFGNAAHASGLLTGMLVALAFMPFRRRLLAGVSLGVVSALSAIPLFWCPWSTDWLSWKAWRAFKADDYKESHRLCSQVIARKPNEPWAYSMRSSVYTMLDEPEKAAADKAKSAALKAQ